MQLFKALEKYQKNKKSFLRTSEDVTFYLANRHLFSNIEIYKPLMVPENEMDVIRANAVIRAIQNKKKLDEIIVYAFKESKMKTDEVKDFIHERMTGYPYIKDGSKKIYVPIFSRPINDFYYDDFGKLLVAPYNSLIDDYNASCIDLFEVYNFSLFDSLFTKLITMYKDEKVLVAFHFDFRSIYIINDQGRLDLKIALFDKYIKKPRFNNMIERIRPVVNAYLKGDRNEFCKALVDNELVSERLMHKVSGVKIKKSKKHD